MHSIQVVNDAYYFLGYRPSPIKLKKKLYKHVVQILWHSRLTVCINQALQIVLHFTLIDISIIIFVLHFWQISSIYFTHGIANGLVVNAWCWKNISHHGLVAWSRDPDHRPSNIKIWFGWIVQVWGPFGGKMSGTDIISYRRINNQLQL